MALNAYLTILFLVLKPSEPLEFEDEPRVILNERDIAKRFRFPRQRTGPVKLIRHPDGNGIYAGDEQNVFYFPSGPASSSKVPIFKDECNESDQGCQGKISVLIEGEIGRPLFFCAETRKCCFLDSTHNLIDCTDTPKNSLNLYEPALHIGDELYITTSSPQENGGSLGLYRIHPSKGLWPLLRKKEQKYVKVIASRHGDKHLEDKVYAFYTEGNSSECPECPRWVPRVSQVCLSDLGGPKNNLQFSWTSLLSARLFCGDERRRLSFTQLLDLTVAEADHGADTRIYALFQNHWGIRAVCVYTMRDIDHVFKNSSFNMDSKESMGSRPGQCVQDSLSLDSKLLKFMENQPEMVDWVKPLALLLVSHHHYTHIQVDTVTDLQNISHTVLLLSCENGRIHKVLETKDKAFIIAEYTLFKKATKIHSMLLDRNTTTLYVSSSTEVVWVDLSSCIEYGNQCEDCILARDPYCGWDGHCTSVTQNTVQDVVRRNYTVCKNKSRDVPEASPSQDHQPSVVTRAMPYYLRCPITSRHATYKWTLNGTEMACVFVEHHCLLLIPYMKEEHEGTYICTVSEQDYTRTLLSHSVLIGRASSSLSSAPLFLLLLMSALSVISMY